MSADGYTRIMMKRSTVPEIVTLAKEKLAMDDYWNDTSDNIKVIGEQDIGSTTEDHSTLNDDDRKKFKLRLLSVESDKQAKISPNLTYDMFVFPKTPDFKDNLIEKSNVLSQDKDINEKTPEKRSAAGEDQLESSAAVLQR